jgi:hypothetical protein
MDEDLSMGTPDLHPMDEDLSMGTPDLHPMDEDLSMGTPDLGHPAPAVRPTSRYTFAEGSWYPRSQERDLGHPQTNEPQVLRLRFAPLRMTAARVGHPAKG